MTRADAAAALAPGLRASVSAEVTAADTAQALGSGDVPVLGTPRLLALAEAACVAAIAGRLAQGQTTVGTAVWLEHRRAIPVGASVDVEAELIEIAGRKLRFNFIGYGPVEGEGEPGTGKGGGRAGEGESRVIGAGTAERMIVDRAKFLPRPGKRAGAAGS
jgi:predicted thioesterase